MPAICIVRRDYYPQCTHTRRDARALVNEGHQVDVVCKREPGQKTREQLDGVNIYRVPVAGARGGILGYMLEYSSFFLITFLILAGLTLRRRYSCIEVDTMPDFLVFTALAPKLLGAKVVLYFFECMPELFQHDYQISSSHPIIRLLRFIEIRAFRFADHVIYCGPGYRNIQEPRGGKPVPGTVVLNVPDESVLRPKTGSIAKARLPDAPFRIITHGSLLERYGVSTLIEAVPALSENIPNLEVLIVGDGEHRATLAALTKELEVGKIVKFTGWVQHEDLVDLIAGSDVGVSAFLNDCMLPTKLFEYMAVETPVVHSATKFTMDFCQGGEVAFFCPGDEGDLAQQLLWLYKHPEERLAMVERASKLYQACRWDVMRENYLDVYRGLTTSGFSPRRVGDSTR